MLASVCIEQSGEGRGQLILLTAAGEPLYSPRAKLNSLTQLSPEFTGVGVRQPDSQLLELSKPLAGEKWILLTQVNQYQMQSTQQTLHNKSLIVLALSLLLGFVLALLLSALMVVYCFTAGANPVPGYVPPHDSAYYAEHLDELAQELNANVLPVLDETAHAEADGGTVTVTASAKEYVPVRGAVLKFYDAALFTFEKAN